jgi:hypothetical protein
VQLEPLSRLFLEDKDCAHLGAKEGEALVLNGGHVLDALAVERRGQDVKRLVQHGPLRVVRRRQPKFVILHDYVGHRVLHLLHQVRLRNARVRQQDPSRDMRSLLLAQGKFNF